MEELKQKKSVSKLLIILIVLLSTAERIQILGLPVYLLLLVPLVFISIIKSVKENEGRLLIDRFELFVLVWVAVGFALSLVYGTGGDYKAIEGLLINFLILILFYSRTGEDFELSMLVGLVCAFLLNISIGVMEIRKEGFHVVQNFSDAYLRMFAQKAVGFQVNANDYCAMLVITIIGIIYLSKKLEIRKKPVNYLFLAMHAVGIYIIFVDFSRAAIISLLIIAVYIGVYKLFGKRRWKMITLFILLLAVLAILATNGFEESFSAFMDKKSDTQRLGIYSETWSFIKNHYFLGVGIGNTTRITGSSPHNLIFEILSDYGFIIAIPFSIYLIRLINYKTDNDNGKGYHLIALFGICFLLAGFSVSSLLRNRICWVLFAYFVRQVKDISRSVDLDNENREAYLQSQDIRTSGAK